MSPSRTISSYKIASDGSISLLNAIATNTGAGDLDMSLSNNGQFLYVNNIGSHSIQEFSINADGSLATIGSINGLPAATDGLAAN